MIPIQQVEPRDKELQEYVLRYDKKDGGAGVIKILAVNLAWARRDQRYRHGTGLYAASIDWNVFRLASGEVILHEHHRIIGHDEKLSITEFSSVAALCDEIHRQYHRDTTHVLVELRKKLLALSPANPID